MRHQNHAAWKTKSLVIFLLITMFSISSSLIADEKLENYWDYNGDGKEDVVYKWDDTPGSYFEYLDRDYDEAHDQITQYDDRTDWPLRAIADDNFDGSFETTLYYKDAKLYGVVTDSSGDNNKDIGHYYLHELLDTSLKYSIEDGQGTIETITYEYGFPIKIEAEKTNKSPNQFDEYLESIMPQNQSVPLKPSS